MNLLFASENLGRWMTIVHFAPLARLKHLNPWRPQGADEDFARGEAEYKRQRFDRAIKAWLKAASSGHTEAQFRLGECYARGEGVLCSLTDAALWFKRAGEGGH